MISCFCLDKECYDAVSKKRHTSSIEITTVSYNMSLSSVPPKLVKNLR